MSFLHVPKIKRFKISLKKSLHNKGIQTDIENDILKYPRSTQTDSQWSTTSTAVQSDNVVTTESGTQTNNEEQRREFHDTVTQTFIKSMDDKGVQAVQEVNTIETIAFTNNAETQTPVVSIALETRDEETQTSENISDVDAPMITNTRNISEIFKSIHDRERSPFAAILPAVSTMASPSLLFPSLISQALRSGARAGTEPMLTFK